MTLGHQDAASLDVVANFLALPSPAKKENHHWPKWLPFLMFNDQIEAAIEFYTAHPTRPNTALEDLEKTMPCPRNPSNPRLGPKFRENGNQVVWGFRVDEVFGVIFDFSA